MRRRETQQRKQALVGLKRTAGMDWPCGTLGLSLKTTNCLESLNAQLGQLTGKVDRWCTSDQKHRWVASAVLAIEHRLRCIKGYRHLAQLHEALQRDIQRKAVTELRIA